MGRGGPFPLAYRMSDNKLDTLLEILRKMPCALLAYSGGLDSTFLLKALKLSGIRTLAVTGVSDTVPPSDLENAKRMAREIGMEHRIIHTHEMDNENFVKNPPDRCFHCKDELFTRLRAIAEEEGCASVLDGSNVDDREDYRPGSRAARKHGVRSPLEEAGFAKQDIRDASRELGLSTWDRPASPCLSSRFPYGMEITPGALKRVAGAEEYLRSLGVGEIRVRDHYGVARLEVRPQEQQAVFEMRRKIVPRLKALGYRFVCLDLEGFESGSLNRMLKEGTEAFDAFGRQNR